MNAAVFTPKPRSVAQDLAGPMSMVTVSNIPQTHPHPPYNEESMSVNGIVSTAPMMVSPPVPMFPGIQQQPRPAYTAQNHMPQYPKPSLVSMPIPPTYDEPEPLLGEIILDFCTFGNRLHVHCSNVLVVE